ncbi:hypothetical protein ACWKT5_05790 [Streptomyces avermitilis]
MTLPHCLPSAASSAPELLRISDRGENLLVGLKLLTACNLGRRADQFTGGGFVRRGGDGDTTGTAAVGTVRLGQPDDATALTAA